MASLRSTFFLLALTSFFCCSSERYELNHFRFSHYIIAQLQFVKCPPDEPILYVDDFSVRKELRDKETYQENVIQLGHSVQSNKIDPSRVIQLSWRPRVFLYTGFLSDEECDHLISLANVAEEKTLGTSLHPVNVFTNRTQLTAEDDIVARIEERISAWTFLPKENSKPLQLMHYGLEVDKQKLDYFGNKSTLGLSERLMAAVILYLSNVSRGGEVLFPDSAVKDMIWSDCAKVSNAQRPVKGNAILFFTLHPNASPDESSSHARCPVLEGDMWCAAKFFQLRSVKKEKVSFDSDGSECTDEDESCPHWAAAGECQRNPVYMIGSPDYYGTCRKSCGAC